MGATMIELLCDTLFMNGNRLRKFALVNVQHSDRSFEKLINVIYTSAYL